MDEVRNTYSGQWTSLQLATECVAKLSTLGYTDVTLTSVPKRKANMIGDPIEQCEWSYHVDAVQRTANEASIELEAQRKVREIA